jgi:uncharacterized protein (DUF58 family)
LEKVLSLIYLYMIPKEILSNIRRIEITTNRLVTDVFAGAYHSVFKGQGIEFDEVREYNPGDDIRSIDWNVTARMGRAFIKKFVEERELTVMIVMDASRSSHFGTIHKLKNQLAAEISALLSFSAVKNNDKVGLLIFTDKIEKYIAPRKGLKHVLRVIREILYFKPQGTKTDLNLALEYLNNVLSRKSVCFLISDFYMDIKQKEVFKKRLKMTNRHHDVIAVTLNDPREQTLPEIGIIALEDIESGEIFYLDSSNPSIRQKFKEENQKKLKEREDLFRFSGVDTIELSTGKPYVDEIIKFFLKRRRRKSI